MTATDAPAWTLPLDSIYAAAKERIDNPDFIHPSVEVWFEGEDAPAWKCLLLNMPEGVSHRDAGLHACKVMASASGADYVVFTFDTHASPHTDNPTTGKPWEPGEMQRMCDEEGYCETGNIRDNLIVAIARRSDGKMLQHGIPYHFHGQDNSKIMFWDELTLSEWDEDGSGSMQGRIPNAMREAITFEPVSTRLEALLGRTVEEMNVPNARLYQIIAGARILAKTARQYGAPMMFVSAIRTDTDEEREVLQHSMEVNGLEDPLAGSDDDE